MEPEGPQITMDQALGNQNRVAELNKIKDAKEMATHENWLKKMRTAPEATKLEMIKNLLEATPDDALKIK